MKKPILLLLMLSLFAVSAFAAPTVAFNGMGKTGTYVFPAPIGEVYAGELLFTASGFAAGSGVANVQFTTFCIEADEHINWNGTYDAILNTEAWNGGRGGPNPDPLSKSTAWLYNNYLDSYVSVSGSSSNATEARNYQMAIWYLEQEIGNISELSSDAQTLVGNANAAVTAGWNNTTIRVLNLYALGTSDDDTPVFKQDCLVRITQGSPPIVPVPGAILLGGIGVSLVGWLRKRQTL